MRIVYFTHSLISCWNHGNAHFQRGVLRELAAQGHDVIACEPRDSWSRMNLVADYGEAPIAAFHESFPELRVCIYDTADDVVSSLDGADLVLVHEWNHPWVIGAIGRARRMGGQFLLLFHDTHHRIISDPESLRAYNLSDFDGILAFGEAIAEVWRAWGWGARVHVWHEAADTRLFRPAPQNRRRSGVVWIGNWGDGERSGALRRFLLAPTLRAGLSLDVHGVRYPEEARRQLAVYCARYHGWLGNADVPAAFGRHLATIHVPRRFYTDALPGIPTIRVFEALACGIPLVCAPWSDSEGLFRPGEDYLVATDDRMMARHLRVIADDAERRTALVQSGLATIAARHSCAHRARQLLTIAAGLKANA